MARPISVSELIRPLLLFRAVIALYIFPSSSPSMVKCRSKLPAHGFPAALEKLSNLDIIESCNVAATRRATRYERTVTRDWVVVDFIHRLYAIRRIGTAT